LALRFKKFGKIIKIFQSSGYVPYLWALIHGVVAGVEHTNVLWSLNCRTVIDVGANCGQFALVSRKCFPQARIVSFEPLAGPANRFRNLFQRDPGVILHQAAIGPMTGESTIHVAAADDSSSLLPISTTQERLFPGTSEIRTEIVRVGPLSTFVASEEIVYPAMLKLDVQGYELQALRGCEELLERFGYVYAECSFMELYSGQALAHDIVHWLGERGWCLRGFYNTIYDCKGKGVQADFLFENLCFARAV
jgi:FkbM family methyltransferase